jgi:hypothetical protein
MTANESKQAERQAGCDMGDHTPSPPFVAEAPVWLAIGHGEGTADQRIVRNSREMVDWLWEQCGPDYTGKEESTRNFWFSYLEDGDNWMQVDGAPQFWCRIDVGETGHVEFIQLLDGVVAQTSANDQLRAELAAAKQQAETYFRAMEAKQAKIDALMLEFCPGEMSAERRWVTNLDAAAEHLYRVTAAAAGFTKHPEWQELAEQTRVTYYVEAVLRKKHEAFLPPPPQGDGRE